MVVLVKKVRRQIKVQPCPEDIGMDIRYSPAT